MWRSSLCTRAMVVCTFLVSASPAAGQTSKAEAESPKAGAQTVTAQSPVVPTSTTTPSTTVTSEELEKIPTARDPWAILQTMPGVMTDRVNVGGSDNGQPLNATAGGAAPHQTQWMVDGANLTDPAAAGTPPVYYDFDAVDKIEIQTGGTSVSTSSPGLVINIVTKRGTNAWRGSARYYLGAGGADEEPPADRLNGRGTAFSHSNDFGGEAGGPIIKDRLWLWGSYGQQNNVLDAYEDLGIDPILRVSSRRGTAAATLNGNLGSNDRFTFNFFHTNRSNDGISQNPIRLATSANERSSPTSIRFEDTHIFSSNFYLTGMYSITQGGFQLVPNQPAQPLFIDDGIERGFFHYDANRDSQQFKLDGGGSLGGPLNHELRFGLEYRKASVTDAGHWNDDIIILPDSGSSFMLRTPRITRATDISYGAMYVQDTIRKDKLTANFGLRFDSQHGSPGRSTISFPFNTGLPAAAFVSTDDAGIDWNDISPRIGLSYALDDARKTVVRASFARYADVMKTPVVDYLNPLDPLSFAGSELYEFNDLNNNRVFDATEPREFLGFPFNGPSDPALLDPLNRVDPDLSAPTTHELLFGVEHALLPEFVIGLNVTRRSMGNLLEGVAAVTDGTTTRAATALDYVSGGNLSGSFNLQGLGPGIYNAPLFNLRPGLTDTGGVWLANGDRGQNYTGASLTFNKRLANRWMLRGNFSVHDWTWSESADASHRPLEPESRHDGGVVAPASSVLGRENVFMNMRWDMNLFGLYQVAPDRPWGFDLSGHASARQGFPAPLFRISDTQVVPLLDLDRFRYDAPALFDVQAAKTLTVGGKSLRLSVEVFNLFSNTPVLQRDLNLDHSTAGRSLDHVQGRVLRIGARVNFP